MASSDHKPEGLLSIREAAKLLNRSTKSLRNYVKEGRLKAEKVPGPKGPQFVFPASGVERLAKELRLDIASQLVHAESDHGSAPNLPMNLPTTMQGLVEAFVVAERDRIELLQQLASSKADSGHTIGVLEERVAQLQLRLKREERISEHSKDLEKDLRAWKKKTETKDEELRRLRELTAELSRRRWWQLFRAPASSPEQDEE